MTAITLTEQKFNRFYYLNAFTPNETQTDDTAITGTEIEISYPITCQFKLEKFAAGRLNTLDLKLYNINPNNAIELLQSRYETSNKEITFSAGYLPDARLIFTQQNSVDEEARISIIKNSLPIIFKGHIVECYTDKSGTDWITSIMAQEGITALANTANFTLKEGSTKLDLLNALAQAANLEVGSSQNLEKQTFPRGFTTSGSVYEELQKAFDDNVFIDQNTIHKLENEETILNEEIEISVDTGLLNIPKFYSLTTIIIETMFEPNAKTGIIANFVLNKENQNQSSNINNQNENLRFKELAKIFGGSYKIIGFTHDGIISGAVNGDCKTSFEVVRVEG